MSLPDARIPDDILDQLPQCFAGDPDSASRVETWAARHPEHRTLIAGARRVWDEAAGPACARPAEDVDAAWARFQARVSGSAGTPDAAEPGAG